jgi:tripartite-type tricarboxylate transporter receptor subunit TctC
MPRVLCCAVSGGGILKLQRRQFLHLAAGAAALPAVSRVARAQAYPTRPVRIIVGFGPGGVTDIVARIMAQWLSDRLGQPFVVENRPGGGTNIATEVVVRAAPDGYTLLLTTSNNLVNATLFDKLSFNFIQDIAPVASINRTPAVMEVNPSVPAKTVPEFIAYAKANPGKLNMAAVGPGSVTHIHGELFKMMAGVDLITVQYSNPGPALIDLMRGQVQVMFDPVVSSLEHIRAGELRALAVTTTARLEVLPDIPTVGDFVPGYEASGLAGIGAPKSTPGEIIEKLNGAINAGLADPKLKARLAELGAIVVAGTPADFSKLIADETGKWAKVIRAANIKPE